MSGGHQPWQGQFAPQEWYFAPPPPQPPRKPVGLWIGLAVVLVAVLGIGAWLIVETTSEPDRPAAAKADTDRATKIVKSTDGHSRLTVPAQWVELPEDYRSPASVIAQGQIYQERYVMVITDDEADFAAFTEFEEAALDGMAEIADGATVGQPREVALGSLRGIRYEVTGEVDGIDIVYWFTLVDGGQGYHQVVAWTLADRRPDAEKPLHDVVATFEETG
ncbi:hypothetical protein [Actinokineospora sp.]|uniref:hypothetical protein n=1 Tax=Actinokineospora sp. TaxID=1872133 RepID=UPI0040380035